MLAVKVVARKESRFIREDVKKSNRCRDLDTLVGPLLKFWYFSYKVFNVFNEESLIYDLFLYTVMQSDGNI